MGNRLGQAISDQSSLGQAEELLNGEVKIISSDDFHNTVYHGSYDEQFSVDKMQHNIPNVQGERNPGLWIKYHR